MSLSLQPVFPTWAIVLIFVLGAMMLLTGPTFGNLSPRRRWTLGLFRLGVLGLALIATLRPGCVQQIEKSQAAVLLFLVDVTRSMELPHVTDDSTRWGAVEKVIQDNQSRFQKLMDNQIDVQFYGFDNRHRKLEIRDGRVQLPDIPEGGETDIGSAIHNTSLEVRNRRLLGLFVLSDGVQNVLDPSVPLPQAAETLNDLEVPLFTVPFGLPGDTGQLADIAITQFAEQQMVNLKNDLKARATLVARGYANQDIKVDLLLMGRDGSEQLVATQLVRPDASYSETSVELKYRPLEPGEYRIKVRANPMPGELALRNNELDAFLTVNDKGMRVLMLAGDIGWEQSFLRRSLPTTEFIQLDFVPIYPSSRESWPETRYESAFRDPAYDVFILADLDSTALHRPGTYTKSLDALADSVYDGKGLLMIGGYHSFGAGSYHQTPLADILPVKMNANERQDFGVDVRRDLHINTPFKLRPAKDHFLTRLSDEGLGPTIWNQLPELVGANRFGAKDNAEILLESNDEVGRPILVASNVGGRVLAFAGDSTWRWKMRGFDKEYDQFWRQAILWLAGWDRLNDESVSIEMSQRRFQPKAIVKFDVIVKTVTGEPIDDATFKTNLVTPSGQRHPVNINQSQSRYFSQLDPESLVESGLYQIESQAFQNEKPIGTSRREFVVMDRDKEKSNPVANPEQMARLANQTNKHGGQVILPEEVTNKLDELIANPPITKIEIPVTWRLGQTFPDAAAFLTTFATLLLAEWFFRKKWGLV